MSLVKQMVTGAAVLATVFTIAACGNGSPAASSSGSSNSSTSAPSISKNSVGEAGATLPGTVGQVINASDQLHWTPNTVSVKVGEIVEFENAATNTITHNVTIEGQTALSSTSQYLAPGMSWEVEFTTPGTYPFECTIHPGMTGVITVTAS